MNTLLSRLLLLLTAAALGSIAVHAANPSPRDARKKIVMLIAEHEYDTTRTRP